jgi:hypothetical protein
MGNNFKAIEKAVKGAKKKKVLQEKPLTMSACFGPECAEKVRQQNSSSGTSLPKGSAEASDNKDNEQFEAELLKSTKEHDGHSEEEL